jgi:hypothetical protein
MPCYKITYTRKDMEGECSAIKYAHTPKDAEGHLLRVSAKIKVEFNIIKTEEEL